MILGVIFFCLLSDLYDLSAMPVQQESKQMFQSPKNWKQTQRSESVLFYDAPNLKNGESCRVAVAIMTPSEFRGSFKEWFDLAQSPDKVIEESNLDEGKSKGGYETLRVSKVVQKSSGKLYRLYFALRDGKQFALILCTASSEAFLKMATKETEALADSWDFSGKFPAIKDK